MQYRIQYIIRTGFCSPDLADFHDLHISFDEQLLYKILACLDRILRTQWHSITASEIDPHNRQLPDRISRLTDSTFIIRMLYYDVY